MKLTNGKAVIGGLWSLWLLCPMMVLGQTTYTPYNFTTFAGQLGKPGSADGVGTNTMFNGPRGMTVGMDRSVYVTDTDNQTIRKISPEGRVTTLAGQAGTAGSTDGTAANARFYRPVGIAVDGAGNVYATEWGNRTIRKITPDGVVITVAGMAGKFGSNDGPGSDARFYSPNSVAVDAANNLYVADDVAQTIRKINRSGLVSTLAGSTLQIGSSDGQGAAARFHGPGVGCVDGAGNLYVADCGNSTIRKISPAGMVTTLAGVAGSAGSADGPMSSARFFHPRGVALDGAGNLFVADGDNNTIRKINPAGIVTTVAGIPGKWGSADGAGSGALFIGPGDVAVDNAGNLYVADTFNHAIRKGVPVVLPTILQSPRSQTVDLGRKVSWQVMAVGTEPLTYEWLFNGQLLAGATGPSLTKTNVQGSDAGQYVVVVANAAGSVTSAVANLSVTLPPSLTQQPQSQTVAPGSTVTFSVVATGTALAYQWIFNGRPIPGATTSSLTKANVQPSDAGPYAVAVANTLDSVVSAVVTLTVIVPPPRITNARLSGSMFTLWVSTVPGQTYILEYQTTLGDSIWVPLQTTTATGGSVTFTDDTATGPARYYRVRIQ